MDGVTVAGKRRPRPSPRSLGGDSREGRPAVPEVAPGGYGTRFCGKYRVAFAGRAAAVPVRRGARPVGARAAAGGRDGGGLAGVRAAPVAVPFVRADARSSAG